MGMRRTYAVSIILISILWLLVGCDRSNYDTIQPVKAKIGKAGKLYSNFTMEYSGPNKKRFSEVVCEVKPGQSILIMENPRWETFKVQLIDGSMGWIEAEYIEPSKRTNVKYTASGSNRHIASNRGAVGAARKIVKEVNEKTAVTRLEEYRDTNKRTGYSIDWTKVRTDDGIEGWIMSEYLYRVPIDTPRFINRKMYRYNMPGFVESNKGRSIDDFIAKYKEPSAVKKAGGQDINYFNNIYLFDKNNEYYGVRIYVKSGLIENIDAGAKKSSWVSYMPLSSELRINWLANYLGNWNYIFENENNPNEKTVDLWDYLPSWLAWIVTILIILLMVGILILILKIPYYIINKITFKQSLNRKLFNGRILFYATLLSIIFGYLYYILMVVNIYPFNEYFTITTLFCLGMLLGNISKWRNDLDYNRCNAPTCHQWTGEDNGTEFLGGSTVTQNIRHGDGRTETNKQTTRRYRDYRKCSACGHEWSIIRTQVIGSLKV